MNKKIDIWKASRLAICTAMVFVIFALGISEAFFDYKLDMTEQLGVAFGGQVVGWVVSILEHNKKISDHQIHDLS